MKGRLPVAMAIPLRRPGDAARVVLIGPPGPLRSAIAEQLRARTTLLACLDLPGHLEHVPSRDLSHARLTDAAVVFLTVPRPPRLASRLWRKYREPRLIAAFEQAAAAAWHQGAARGEVSFHLLAERFPAGEDLAPAQDGREGAPRRAGLP